MLVLELELLELLLVLELVAEFRPAVTARSKDYNAKKALWESVIESDVFSLVERGEIDAARRRLSELLNISPAAPAGR